MALRVPNLKNWVFLIIAVLIILGILAAVAVPRYIDLEQNAKERAIDAAISELNGRESLVWADVKISQTGYDNLGGDTEIVNRLKDGATYPEYCPSWAGILLRSRGNILAVQNRACGKRVHNQFLVAPATNRALIAE